MRQKISKLLLKYLNHCQSLQIWLKFRISARGSQVWAKDDEFWLKEPGS